MQRQNDRLTELQTAYRESVAQFNALDLAAPDLDAYLAHMHDQVTYMSPASHAPLRGKEQVRDWYRRWLKNFESVDWRAVEPEFLVVESTGLVFSRCTFCFKTAGQDWQSLDGQHTVVFVRIEDQWLKLAEHFCQT